MLESLKMSKLSKNMKMMMQFNSLEANFSSKATTIMELRLCILEYLVTK